MRKKVMISQPIAGVDEDTVIETWELARYNLLIAGYSVVDSFITEDATMDIIHPAIWYLSKSLETMAECNAVYFCKGWENARGCKIEHEAAKNYGLEIIYEE